MKITVLLFFIISLASCKKGNDFLLISTQKNYWQVYTIKDCGSDYLNNPKSSLSKQRWVFDDNKYYKYATNRKGIYKFISPVGRDFVIDNSWCIKNNSLYLDGGNLRMYMKILSEDSLIISGVSNCTKFPPSGITTEKTLFVYALSRKSK